MPCSEKRARQLLQRKRAVVHKMQPFTIRLKDRIVEKSQLQPLRLKLDSGSKITGFAVLREYGTEKSVAILMGELHHKPGIKTGLDNRRALRRSRRNRKTRYRKPRFINRTRRQGWLPPSLRARVNQTLSVVTKLRNVLPIITISTEHVKFDTQLIQSPNISSIEYQQGELFGYEVKEYLLEKWRHRCAYCHETNVPLHVEHVIPRNPKRGCKGTNRISNLALACKPCNDAKNNLQPVEWLGQLMCTKKAIDQKRAKNLPEVLKQLKTPLKDAAIMNITRWELLNCLKKLGLSVESGTGARTKKQRIEHKLPKTHYYDACCVGPSTPQNLVTLQKYVLIWKAIGRGTRQMCNTDKYGFPKGHRQNKKNHFGFQTNDMVKADIPRGKYQGNHAGRVAVRTSGYFDIKNITGNRICQGINHKYFQLSQRADGWQYEKIKIT